MKGCTKGLSRCFRKREIRDLKKNVTKKIAFAFLFLVHPFSPPSPPPEINIKYKDKNWGRERNEAYVLKSCRVKRLTN